MSVRATTQINLYFFQGEYNIGLGTINLITGKPKSLFLTAKMTELGVEDPETDQLQSLLKVARTKQQTVDLIRKLLQKSGTDVAGDGTGAGTTHFTGFICHGMILNIT